MVDAQKSFDMNPAISVICPCFNHGLYIGEMLASVQAQTFPDYEVIIVNNGSTDDTGEVLDHLCHKKVAVIHSTAFFKKEDWKAVGGYSNELIYGLEDYDNVRNQ